MRRTFVCQQVFNNILETIGHTPVVRLNSVVPKETNSTVYAKLEYFNPLHSVKDRLAWGIISKARQTGALKPGQTVVESTSGNTGIGLAMVCAAMGHPLVVCMPETFSIERRKTMKFLGAKLILTPAAARGSGAQEKAVELASLNNWFLASQFANPANGDFHAQTTGPEILSDFAGKQLDFFVTGFGTGGTYNGVSRVVRAARTDTKFVLVEPEPAKMVASGKPNNPDGAHPAFSPHPIQGWSPNFLPGQLTDGMLRIKPDEVIAVTGDESLKMAKRLAKEEGIFTGMSGGGSVAGAVRVAVQNPGSVVLTMIPDTAERYQSGLLFEDVSANMSDEEQAIMKMGKKFN